MQWMQYRLSRKMPGLPLPELDDMLKGTEMLETNIDQWKAKAVAEGLQIGRMEGKLEGKLEGQLEGKLEGEARALQHLLSRRFGAIPMDIVERIAAANLEQIETWFDAAHYRAGHRLRVHPRHRTDKPLDVKSAHDHTAAGDLVEGE
jgi:hypothetical protein